PSTTCKSLWHTPVATVRTSTSRPAGLSTSTASIVSGSKTLRKTAAFICIGRPPGTRQAYDRLSRAATPQREAASILIAPDLVEAEYLPTNSRRQSGSVNRRKHARNPPRRPRFRRQSFRPHPARGARPRRFCPFRRLSPLG